MFKTFRGGLPSRNTKFSTSMQQIGSTYTQKKLLRDKAGMKMSMLKSTMKWLKVCTTAAESIADLELSMPLTSLHIVSSSHEESSISYLQKTSLSAIETIYGSQNTTSGAGRSFLTDFAIKFNCAVSYTCTQNGTMFPKKSFSSYLGNQKPDGKPLWTSR